MPPEMVDNEAESETDRDENLQDGNKESALEIVLSKGIGKLTESIIADISVDSGVP